MKGRPVRVTRNSFRVWRGGIHSALMVGRNEFRPAKRGLKPALRHVALVALILIPAWGQGALNAEDRQLVEQAMGPLRDHDNKVKEAKAAVDDAYFNHLDGLLDKAKGNGEFAQALRIQQEQKDLEQGILKPMDFKDAKIPLDLRRARHALEQRKLRMERQAAPDRAKATRDTLKLLDIVRRTMGRDGRFKEALEVEDLMKDLVAPKPAPPGPGAPDPKGPVPTPGSSAVDPPKTQTVTLAPGVTMDLVAIPPGVFMMGSPESEPGRSPHETRHRVRVSREFWIGRTEVTQKQWKALMGSNPSTHTGDNRPVDSATWEQAVLFCAKLNEKLPSRSGNVFRLPTEAEWEYAARAGTETAYHTGDTITEEQAQFNKPSGATVDVGSFPPNAWGLHDMHGNVWEFCHDATGNEDNKANAPYEDNATDPVHRTGTQRVVRGGGRWSPANQVRSAIRGVANPNRVADTYGFRVVFGPALD